VDALDRRGVVADDAGRARVGEERAEAVVGQVRRRVADDDGDADRLGAGRHHGDGLGVAVGVDEEDRGAAFRDAPGHRHGLRGGGALVEQ